MRVYRLRERARFPNTVSTAVRIATGLTVVFAMLMQGAPESGTEASLAKRGVEAIPTLNLTKPEPVAEFLHEPSWIATPQALPVQGWFSDGYKWRHHPITGERRFHRGLDIVAPAGSVVRAPADGVVTHAAGAGGYGKMVELDHRSGFRTRFAHLAKFLVQEGEIVRLGDDIGMVGSTGLANGVHLHYEVLRDGRHVNPWHYLDNTEVD